MTLECRIKEKYDESETGYYLVAEIVNILVDEKYLAEDGNPDMEKMELIVFDPFIIAIYSWARKSETLSPTARL